MLFQAFRKVVDSYPNKIAVMTIEGEQYTYLDLLHTVQSQVAGLRAAGINPGDIVSTWLDNSISYVSLLLSLAALGAIHCPINRLTSKDRAAHRFATVKPVLLISSDGSCPSDNAPITLSLQQILREPQELDHDCVPQTGIFRMQETSGSTGTPKLAMWRQDKMLHEIEHWVASASISSSDIAFNLHTLDGGHAVDLHVLPALLSGGTLVLGDMESPKKTLRAISDSQATVISALPQQYKMLCEAAEETGINQLPNLRLPMCGGGYLSDLVVQESYDKLGILIRRIYGSTEFGMILANFEPIIQIGCGMHPVGDVTIRLEPLSPENATVGEIVAKSTHCGSGYFGKHDQERSESGWYHTGDVAKQINRQTFMPIGRLSDSLNTLQGVIFAPQFEEILDAKVSLAQVVVLSEKNNMSQDHATIVVQPINQDDRAKTDKEIRKIMASYGISGSLHMVESIPMTPTGKPDKPLLRCYSNNTDKHR